MVVFVTYEGILVLCFHLLFPNTNGYDKCIA